MLVLLTLFSILFWFGDLNYRIGLPDCDVRQMVKQGNYKELFEYDQVRADGLVDLASLNLPVDATNEDETCLLRISGGANQLSPNLQV